MPLPFNVIIADDHPLFRRGLSDVVKESKNVNRVFEAANGKEVMDILDNNICFIVFMDVNMPEINGIECTLLIRDKYPEVKVIAVSVSDDPVTIRNMFEAGCMGYLLKNEGESGIHKAIEAVRSGKKYFGVNVPEILLIRQMEIRKKFNSAIFSDMEMTILKAICFEKTNEEISEIIFRSPRTIERIRQKILKKAKAHNALGLLRFAIRNEIISREEI